MARTLTVLLMLSLLPGRLRAREPGDAPLPVRGFCIAAPRPAGVAEFIRFIDEELVPRSVNTLVLRVDFNFRYASQPDLADPEGLSREDVGRIAEACRKGKVRVIPQINLLGHQSWAGQTHRLLKVHPEFDETPWVEMPAKYTWPNADGLYCKSYCPLHPRVHEVAFAIVDELCDAFGADAFHAGLDEVFYIGEDRCPRCKGRDKAVLFAGEVTRIRDHLREKGRTLWMWGDRLIDGKASGLGEWEASTNGTDRAIDLIPRDVVVCDWHYERAVPTPAYFATKGLDVVACPWKKPEVAVRQVRSMREFRDQSGPTMKAHLRGVMQTVWSGCDSFLDEFYGRKPAGRRKDAKPGESESACFKALFSELEAATAR